MRLKNGEVLLAWPLAQHLITAGNYYRNSNGSYTTWHGAIDMRCTWNGTTAQPVYAAEDGTVNWTQHWNGVSKKGIQSYGNSVKIKHNSYKGKPLETRYAHLSQFVVSQGQAVKEGQIIGYTGNSGNSSGAHLHFEVILNGKRMNPLCWLDDDFKAASGFQPYTYGPGEGPVKREETNPVPVNSQYAVDISKHQGTFNPNKAFCEGIDTVIARTNYGTSNDVKFDIFATDCNNSNVRLGAYIFFTYHYQDKNQNSVDKARLLMREQVNACIANLKKYKITSWIGLDQELEKGHYMGLDKTQNTLLLNEAAALFKQAGYHPCIYCSAGWADSRMYVNDLTCPLWLAYYYNDPNDPDFNGCPKLSEINGRWARYMETLGNKLCAWQFGRIGYGQKYGAGSDNLDRDIIYYQPEGEKEMEFTPLEGKELIVTSAKNPACQAFGSPDVNDANCANLEMKEYPITAIGDKIEIASMIGQWYKIDFEQPYVLALPDRCKVEDVEEPNPPQPDPDPIPPVSDKINMVINNLPKADALIIEGVAMKAGADIKINK